MKSDITKTSLPWQQIAHMWKTYFTIPSRISPSEARKYREWLKQIIEERENPLKALVMGATPELRDALSGCGYIIHSIDINPDMFLAMDELLQKKNPQEVLIKANWLDNQLPDNSYDVIVGDAILPNVPWTERQNLLSEIERLLKPDGIFLTRSFLAPKNKRFDSVEEILKHFSKTRKEPMMQLALEMALELQYLTYSPKDHLGSFAKAKDVLTEYHKIKGSNFKDIKLQKIHDVVWNFWCKDFADKVFTYAYGSQEEADYKKYFRIKETFEANDHSYSKLTPIYYLLPKG